ncbi:SRGAP1 [Cordylochernes scorpioides]|uniref:SRGAP1 n=1 Tax=Cordylochernes scorpioides TaxID=51811 RepID=A0ABY6KZ94_9ARAC|nr:SRGAP1 [Cordylochernes scorpioides]
MDFGLHTSLGETIQQHLCAQQAVVKAEQVAMEGTAKCVAGLDSRADKQRFLEANNSAFMVPRKFEFQPPHRGEVQNCLQISIWPTPHSKVYTIPGLKFVLEYDTGAAQIWKTLETAEHSLLAMMSAPEIDVSAMFDEEPPARPPETLALKVGQ